MLLDFLTQRAGQQRPPRREAAVQRPSAGCCCWWGRRETTRRSRLHRAASAGLRKALCAVNPLWCHGAEGGAELSALIRAGCREGQAEPSRSTTHGNGGDVRSSRRSWASPALTAASATAGKEAGSGAGGVFGSFHWWRMLHLQTWPWFGGRHGFLL